ncbi:hypothetical protein [uncultured Bacteroides sp.]|uniref:hypothetical protein n=1 Tax=uncultured Bacteroides sp. TaxID=162156 RepID=UPI002AAAD9EF|nr:hypothetical protein [uncultured Bacteroides sp.]
MKKIKYYIIFLIALTFISCNSNENDPEACPYYVKTKSTSGIEHNFAYINYSISSPDFKGNSGVILSTTPSFDNPIDLKGYNSQYVKAYDLTKNTTYYSKAYVEDIYKNRIYGNVLSFKTLDYVVCLKDLGACQIAKRYLETGDHKYEFDWMPSMIVIDAEDIAECGFIVDKIRYPATPENGTVFTTITTKSNSSTVSQQYIGYAILKNGDLIGTQIKVCNLSYDEPLKSSTNQK